MLARFKISLSKSQLPKSYVAPAKFPFKNPQIYKIAKWSAEVQIMVFFPGALSLALSRKIILNLHLGHPKLS